MEKLCSLDMRESRLSGSICTHDCGGYGGVGADDSGGGSGGIVLMGHIILRSLPTECDYR